MDLRLSWLKKLVHPDNFWVYKYSYNSVLEYEFCGLKAFLKMKNEGGNMNPSKVEFSQKRTEGFLVLKRRYVVIGNW